MTEEIVVAGGELLEFVKRAVTEGNVRRLIIKKANDEVLLEILLTAGAVVGGALAIVAPVLAALGAGQTGHRAGAERRRGNQEQRKVGWRKG